MDAGRVEAYRDYVGARLEPLRRTAYLLCGDWHTADDLVSTALVKLLRHWRRVAAMDHPRRVRPAELCAASGWTSGVGPGGGRRPGPSVPDRPAGHRRADRGSTMLALLAELPPRRRAVLVLRYFCDLSVEETAQELGCTPAP